MKWILLVYMVSSYSNDGAPSGFSAEFRDIESCKQAYREVVAMHKKLSAQQSIGGVCVQDGKQP